MRRRTFDDVSLEIPDAWLNASVVTLIGDEGEALAPTVVMTREEAPAASLERHVASGFEDMRRQFKQHRVLDQGPTTVAGRQGWRLDHRFLTPDRVKARQRQLYFVVGSDLVIVALTAAEAEWAHLEPRFDAIAASLALTPSGEDR